MCNKVTADLLLKKILLSFESSTSSEKMRRESESGTVKLL
jgi:hypothetical protein